MKDKKKYYFYWCGNGWGFSDTTKWEDMGEYFIIDGDKVEKKDVFDTEDKAELEYFYRELSSIKESIDLLLEYYKKGE